MYSCLRRARVLNSKPSVPRHYPTTGFEVIASSQLVEEETWEWYAPEKFYPVRIGELFKRQYQVVGKLGYGAHGTAWLCRDLMCALFHRSCPSPHIHFCQRAQARRAEGRHARGSRTRAPSSSTPCLYQNKTPRCIACPADARRLCNRRHAQPLSMRRAIASCHLR